MLEEIYIGGHSKGTAQEILKKRPKEFDSLIITNHDVVVPEEVRAMSKDVLHLTFDDIVGHSPFHPEGKYILATKDHIKEALTWAEGRPKLLVACHAGVSRSSGLAYVIAAVDWGPQTALRVFRPGWHWPNVHVVKLGAEVLESPSVWNTFREWYSTHASYGDEEGWDEAPDFIQK